MDADTFVLDFGSHPAEFARCVDRLLAASTLAMMLRPERATVVRSVQEVALAQELWPGWRSRPWIIAGRRGPSAPILPYCGLFLEENRSGFYDELAEKVLADFDWCVFSYFTTYRHELCVLLVRSGSGYEISEQAGDGLLFEAYRRQPARLAGFRGASFSDYGAEGWLAYELARERREALPLLLCAIDEGNDELYRPWNDQTGEREPNIWFEAHLAQLEPVDELRVTGPWGGARRYTLHRASNFDAYLALWSMSSHDHSIAEATLSGDCNLMALREILRSGNGFDLLRDTRNLCTWAYGQIYGGGSDEHHAIFYSREPALTDTIWRMAEPDRISRF